MYFEEYHRIRDRSIVSQIVGYVIDLFPHLEEQIRLIDDYVDIVITSLLGITSDSTARIVIHEVFPNAMYILRTRDSLDWRRIKPKDIYQYDSDYVHYAEFIFNDELLIFAYRDLLFPCITIQTYNSEFRFKHRKNPQFQDRENFIEFSVVFLEYIKKRQPKTRMEYLLNFYTYILSNDTIDFDQVNDIDKLHDVYNMYVVTTKI